MTVASCLLTKAPIGSVKEDGSRANVIRPYTPLSRPNVKGHLDLAVKTYEQGKMSKHIGECGGRHPNQGADFHIAYKKNEFAEIGMVAGGTGITPMLQVVGSDGLRPERQDEGVADLREPDGQRHPPQDGDWRRAAARPQRRARCTTWSTSRRSPARKGGAEVTEPPQGAPAGAAASSMVYAAGRRRRPPRRAVRARRSPKAQCAPRAAQGARPTSSPAAAAPRRLLKGGARQGLSRAAAGGRGITRSLGRGLARTVARTPPPSCGPTRARDPGGPKLNSLVILILCGPRAGRRLTAAGSRSRAAHAHVRTSVSVQFSPGQSARPPDGNGASPRPQLDEPRRRRLADAAPQVLLHDVLRSKGPSSRLRRVPADRVVRAERVEGCDAPLPEVGQRTALPKQALL